MSLQRYSAALKEEVEQMAREGRTKAPERVIVDYSPEADGFGPRYTLLEVTKSSCVVIQLYLSLSHHPAVLEAADAASHKFGGPGAVRFIDGTFQAHVDLEESIAAFTGRPAAKIFNSAYTSNWFSLGTAEQADSGDELNHNIIRAMRSANASSSKAIFKHNNMEQLKEIENVPDGIQRVVVIFDGVFSMRETLPQLLNP